MRKRCLENWKRYCNKKRYMGNEERFIKLRKNKKFRLINSFKFDIKLG